MNAISKKRLEIEGRGRGGGRGRRGRGGGGGGNSGHPLKNHLNPHWNGFDQFVAPSALGNDTYIALSY